MLAPSHWQLVTFRSLSPSHAVSVPHLDVRHPKATHGPAKNVRHLPAGCRLRRCVLSCSQPRNRCDTRSPK